MVIIICAWCKKNIKRQDQEAWQALVQPTQLEGLVTDQDVISHGVCPDCSARMHKDMDQLLTAEESAQSL